MKYIIDKKIFERYPGTLLGIIIARNIDNKSNSEEIQEMIREQENEIRSEIKKEEITQHPKIAAWRKVYKDFGEKPKKYQASIENMVRSIIKGNSINSINKIVDIYNLISLKHIVSVGGEDISKVDGDVILKFATGTEPFRALNSEEITHPKEGEVIYIDDKEVLCRRWNWRQCDKTKIDENTSNVALFIEIVPPFTKEEVEKITEELAELVRKHCSSETETGLIEESSPEYEIN